MKTRKRIQTLLWVTGILLIVSLLTCPLAWAAVNLRDASYTRNWIDYERSDVDIQFRLERAYDSRSIESGLFGFGWCSTLDAVIEFQRDGRLLVKDCTAQGWRLHQFEKAPVAVSLPQGQITIYRSSPRLDQRPTPQVTQRLAPRLGQQLAMRTNERIERTATSLSWIRASGARDTFDVNGRLLERRDPHGTSLRLHYRQDGRLARFELKSKRTSRSILVEVTLDSTTGKIRRLNALQGDFPTLTYDYDGENLIAALNAWRHTFHYAYDELHNLNRVEYPDRTQEVLDYDRDRDRLRSFRGRDGCVERYSQREVTTNRASHARHLIAEAVRSCDDHITRRQRREFWIAKNSRGATYLARALVHDGTRTRDYVFAPKQISERN